jgi:lipopolysaccharide transport system ATP-binding protein
MSDIAINVNHVGKRYRIGRAEQYPTIREAVMRTLRHPLSLFGGGGSDQTTELWALRDVSFQVKRGEAIGIIGANGAGKSTMLKILSRITEPSEGYADVTGRVGSLLEVGTGFHPELTGRENIFLNGAILGMRAAEIRGKFDEIVAFSEVEKFIDTPVKRYSSGMYLKLAFAVAAHLDPEILIVDEVLAVGDVAFQRKCLGKMSEVTRSGRTVILVSHYLSAIQSLCQSCVVLHKGGVLMNGPADKCVAKYLEMAAPRDQASAVKFDRPAGSPLWMTGASILWDGQTSATPAIGSTVAFDVTFEAAEPIDVPRLGIVITTADGYRLINLNNRFQQGSGYETPVRSGLIRCDLGAVPFVGKRYYISFFLGNMHGDTHVAENALSFDVMERDIWGTGRVPQSNASAIWWPAKFTFESTSL